MKKEGNVYLWLGNFESQEILDEFIEQHYTDEDIDNDTCDSEFMKHFKISRFIDEDFLEAYVEPYASNEIVKLLQNCSYSEQIIPQFCKFQIKKNYNTVILYYPPDNDFYGLNTDIKSYSNNNIELDYIGYATYIH